MKDGGKTLSFRSKDQNMIRRIRGLMVKLFSFGGEKRERRWRMAQIAFEIINDLNWDIFPVIKACSL
jgi:hypothetical protein